MSVVPVAPRPLSPREAAVVTKLLSVEFDGAAEFRTQTLRAQVVATWGEASPSVDLAVAPGDDQASGIDGELPVSGEAYDERGNYIGEVTLWSSDGYLSAVEYGWVTDDTPEVLPDPARITVSV
ncbi:hypothetical protein ACFXK0_21485 [Nocardia sp. NPDC059177]|uniref:hypothetical protein n=1 Tax=Nocardia sp. NPDC059177 TaxID=3346759 RepID=UPI0036A0911B